jgi:hypothetical protein
MKHGASRPGSALSTAQSNMS